MNRFTTAVATALYWRMAWRDSNPDVGFGPSMETEFDRMLDGTGLEIKDSTRKKVLAFVKTRRREELGR